MSISPAFPGKTTLKPLAGDPANLMGLSGRPIHHIGAGLGGGSGGAEPGFNIHTLRLENYRPADHSRAPVATLPIPVMDRYEHACQMDCGTATAKCIDAFFQDIQWDVATAHSETAQRTAMS